MNTVYLCMTVCLVLGGMVDSLPQSEEGCGRDRLTGEPRLEGDTWYDGCNQCRCLSNGRPGCTKKVCPPHQRETCGGRSQWEEKSGSEVRQCHCDLGEAVCNPTSNRCGVGSDGRQRQVGDRWQESCNTCFCTGTGVPACSFIHCGGDNFPSESRDRIPDSPPLSLLEEVSLRDGTVVQCLQDGVTKCTGVRIAAELSQLKAGANLSFLAGTGITVRLRRDPAVSSIFTSLSLSLEDGGEGTIVVRRSGAVYGTITPGTGSLIYALEACGKDCNVLLQTDRQFFNQFKD